LEIAQPLMNQKGQEILQRVPDSPLWLSGDGVRLVQALSNVLTNAAKYSSPGARIAPTAASRFGAARMLVYRAPRAVVTAAAKLRIRRARRPRLRGALSE